MINHQIVAIPSDKNSLTDALGISEKRKVELLEYLTKCSERDDLSSVTSVMEAATEISANINETAFLSYVMGSASCSSDCPLKKMGNLFKSLNLGSDE
jgi:hypothetical protein